jgi:hypothetical protein
MELEKTDVMPDVPAISNDPGDGEDRSNPGLSVAWPSTTHNTPTQVGSLLVWQAPTTQKTAEEEAESEHLRLQFIKRIHEFVVANNAKKQVEETFT